MLIRQPIYVLLFLCLLVLVSHAALAQPAPTPQRLPHGGRPVVQVAPDGAVHLDGPMASYSMPSANTQSAAVAPVQPGVVLQQPVAQFQQPIAQFQQPVAQFQQPGTQSRIGNWLFNNPIPYQYEHRTGVFGEFLYIRPRNAEIAYALPIDGPINLNNPVEVPTGPAAVVDFTYEPAFRAGFDLRLREDSSIALQYTNFRGDASHAVTVMASDVLRSLVRHPGTPNTTNDTLDASASLNFEYDLIDADYRATVEGCESCEGKFADVVNYIIGARYARLDQDFVANYTTTGVVTNTTSVDFDGGGIRLGLEGERHATNTGLYVYGQGIANLMVGEFKANYAQVFNLNNVAAPEAITSWSGGRIVPAFDLELGLGWVGPRRRLRLSSGYMVSMWFNVVKTEDFINAAQTHDFDGMSSILTFDGLVARAEWEF